MKVCTAKFLEFTAPFKRGDTLIARIQTTPEPLGQFQPNLAHSFYGWGEIKSVQMKGHALCQEEIIAKIH